MAEKLVKPNCKIEDIPTIGEFILTEAQIDLPDLTEAASNIDKPFIDDLKAQNAIVRKLVRPYEMTGTLKKATVDLYGAMESLRPRLNKLEIKINQVIDGLSGSKADFGLVKLRKMIRNKNAEGTSLAVEVLLRQIDSNVDILGTVGFKPEMRLEIVDINEVIIAKNLAQNKIINARGELTQENKIIISIYWTGIKKLMDAGKLLYKDTNPAKAKEYTFAVLKRRVESKRIKKLTAEAVAANK